MAELLPDFKPLAGFNEKLALRTVYIVTGVVFLAVVAMYLLPRAAQGTVPMWVRGFPLYNAFLNGTCFFVLIAALLAVKRRNYVAHMRLNLLAFGLSSLFLLFYIGFHIQAPDTKFPSDNPIRPLYLIILITHILAAIVVLPLVLVTFYLSLSGNYRRHKALARYTFPVWLYVTFTGVVVYLMISPYYRF